MYNKIESIVKISLIGLKNNRKVIIYRKTCEITSGGSMFIRTLNAYKKINLMIIGRRKMLALGMVIVNRPKLLLYDEPLAGLGEENIPTVVNMLGKIRNSGTTMVLVEHHIKEMMDFANITIGVRLGLLSTRPLVTIESIKEIMI